MLGKELPSKPKNELARRKDRSASWGGKSKAHTPSRSAITAPKAPLIALPEPDLQLSQDAEWCLVKRDGEWHQIRFHDYHEIYKVPGLYEKIFYRILKCDSPAEIREQLQKELKEHHVEPAALRTLDVGAGNGMVAEQLTQMGISTIVGIDILPEAREAARRDHPTVYDDYFVVDLTNLAATERDGLRAYRFNCLTCVAALGFGDIPAAAFANALALVETDGWLAFNIKDEFLDSTAKSDFSRLIRQATESGAIEVLSQRRYVHRLATDGQPLEYIAIIARKRRDVFEFLPTNPAGS